MTVLPEVMDCNEFVNADEIAKGLSPLNPESQAIEAGRLMLRRIDELLAKRVSFAIETTLATKSYQRLVQQSQKMGYTVILLFFWLSSPEMAEKRVAQRVASGGHNIPKDVIHRRYWAGLRNLFEIFIPIVDSWGLYNNEENAIPIVESGEVLDINKLNLIKESCQKKKK